MDIHHKPWRRFRVAHILVVLALCLTPFASQLSVAAPAAAPGVWGSGTLTDQNLHDLIAQMTVAEEDTFVHGSSDNACSGANISPWVQGCVGQAGWIPGVARLGIPPLRLSDGPAGVRLGHQETAMPAPVGLTAAFDRDLAHLFGEIVGRGLRATNQDVWLAPMMNQVIVPTAGRNFETLGEDPYLAGELGAELTMGVQSEGIIATLKHYAENDFENGRNSTSVKIDERTMMETELQAFEKSIKAGAGAIMCSYNRVNDVYACGNDALLNQIAKGLFGFKGFVMSDWGATHTSQDLINGLDMEQSGSSNLGNRLVGYITNAVGSPAVAATNDMPAQPAYTSEQWKAALDNAVFRILTSMNNAGLLEGTQYGSHSNGCDPAATPPLNCTPYVPPRPDLQAIQPQEFAAAQSIAEKGAVLLKDADKVLPLKDVDLYSNGKVNGVLVMGPTSIAPYTGGGGSAHVIPFDPVQSPYDALIAAAGPGAHIRYVPGYDLDGQLVPSSVLTAPDPANPYAYWALRDEDVAFANQPGLLRQQIMTATVPSGQQPVLYTGDDRAPDQLDATISYIGANTLPAGTGWRWTGLFTAPSSPISGSYQLKIFVANQASAQLFVDGLTTSGNPNPRKINMGAYPAWPNNSYASQSQTSKSHDPNAQGLQQATWTVTFDAGQQSHVDLRAVAKATGPMQIQFRWIPIPTDWQTQKISEAVEAAKSARKVVIFAYDEGTEGSDRGGNNPATGMVLPGYQDVLIPAVAAANPNTVVVLNTGDPVFMPWANQVKAILEMWYPGQMGGPATANLLLGKANPGGKLPVTFPLDGTHYQQYDPNCTNYGTASSGPGNPNPARQTLDPGNCPLYPGIYQPGFLWGVDPAKDQLHSYREIDFTTNNIFNGYRWYDQKDVQPLYEFGYGLSYTKFRYSKLTVSLASDGGFDVTFRVTNVGDVTGDEVPQVYVGAPSNAPVPMAEKALVQFTRITLASQEWQDVTLHVAPRELSYWDTTQHNWVVAIGQRSVYVGSSSRDIRLEGTTPQ